MPPHFESSMWHSLINLFRIFLSGIRLQIENGNGAQNERLSLRIKKAFYGEEDEEVPIDSSVSTTEQQNSQCLLEPTQQEKEVVDIASDDDSE